LFVSYAKVKMGTMSTAFAMSTNSNGPHPETSESPHTCPIDGRA